MAFNRYEADAVIAAWRKSGKMLMIAQVLRFWPEYVYLKKLVGDGSFGQAAPGRLLAHFRRAGVGRVVRGPGPERDGPLRTAHP